MIAVAGYCRVSTDLADQTNSFAAQQRFFRNYIHQQNDWTLYRIYADEGISGTSVCKRVEFQQMLEDARRGKFRLIVTKEVSRFSRNILDTISYTRELKALGVEVIFLNDGIRTMEADAELRLSIMASIAQEESRKTSERVKWGQTRQMERGVVFGHSLLGYDVREGRLAIHPEGAEIVRQIFRKYALEKKGSTTIARELTAAGLRTPHEAASWTGSYVIRILKNEKYVGDLVQKKTFTPDYLTHKKRYNHGEEELVVLKNHHEPIVDRELWELAQAEMKKRNHSKGSGHGNRYIFSGKIICGECGETMVSRCKRRKDGSLLRKWGCPSGMKGGENSACGIGRMLRDDAAREMLRECIRTLPIEKEKVIRELMALISETAESSRETDSGTGKELVRRRRYIAQKRETILDAFCARRVSEEEMRSMCNRYDSELKALDERIEKAKKAEAETLPTERIKSEIAALLDGERDKEVFCKNVVDHAVVHKDGRVELYWKALSGKWVFSCEKDI